MCKKYTHRRRITQPNANMDRIYESKRRRHQISPISLVNLHIAHFNNERIAIEFQIYIYIYIARWCYGRPRINPHSTKESRFATRAVEKSECVASRRVYEIWPIVGIRWKTKKSVSVIPYIQIYNQPQRDPTIFDRIKKRIAKGKV